MTVRINKPALNLREELTKAQGVVRYEQRQFWMDGLVENGTFDSDVSGWTDFSSSTIAYDNGTINIQTTAYNGAEQQVSVEIGKNYTVSFDVTETTTSTARIYLGTIESAGQYFNQAGLSVGSHNYTLTAVTDTLRIRLATTVQTGDVNFDNVAVFEVDENDNVIHSVPLGFKPVHVYEDGLLQREGENHDYTVVDTGFGYQIKPTVAPTGATETCVIAEREL